MLTHQDIGINHDRKYYQDPNPQKRVIKKYHNYGMKFWKPDQKNNQLLNSRNFNTEKDAQNLLNLIYVIEDIKNYDGFSVGSLSNGKFCVVADLSKINVELTAKSVGLIQEGVLHFLNEKFFPSAIFAANLLLNGNPHIENCAKQRWKVDEYGRFGLESVSIYYRNDYSSKNSSIFSQISKFLTTQTKKFLGEGISLERASSFEGIYYYFKENSSLYFHFLSMRNVLALALKEGEQAKQLAPIPSLFSRITMFAQEEIRNLRLVNSAAAKTYETVKPRF